MDTLPLDKENWTNVCIDDVSERKKFEMEYKSETRKKTVAFYGGKTFFKIRQFRREYGKDLISIRNAQQTQPAPLRNVDETDNIDEKRISVSISQFWFLCLLVCFELLNQPPPPSIILVDEIIHASGIGDKGYQGGDKWIENVYSQRKGVSIQGDHIKSIGIH